MKGYVALAVNENLKYRYFVPLVRWAWKKFGWEPLLFCVGKGYGIGNYIYSLESNGHRSDTVAQVCRLYAWMNVGGGMVMTSDIDMLPLSDYWHPDPEHITSYGRDLTDYHYPICYIAMTTDNWQMVMRAKDRIPMDDHINRDLKRNFKNIWTADQDIITENLQPYHVFRVDRGTDKRTGYPIGRVDRSAWRMDHDQFIDAHLPHDMPTNEASFKKVMKLLHHIWPQEDFNWFVKYHIEWKKQHSYL